VKPHGGSFFQFLVEGKHKELELVDYECKDPEAELGSQDTDWKIGPDWPGHWMPVQAAGKAPLNENLFSTSTVFFDFRFGGKQRAQCRFSLVDLNF
jgi:hypothetical protein